MLPLREENQKITSAPARGARPKRWGLVLLAFICLGAILSAGYFYYQNAKLKKNINSQSTAAKQEQITNIVSRVSRLIVLPQDEEPTVATVSDTAALKDQAFFANAKAGDILLIYAKAKKAILYDAVADKLVEVAPLNLNLDSQKQPAPTQ